jgi:hypothetical protein
MLYPDTFGELLALQDKLTVCTGAATPVPVAESAVDEGAALLVNVRVALAAPAACGVNVKVNGAFVPAAITAGSDKPLMVKLELLLLAAVTVTLAPLAVRDPEAVPLLPTKTLPAGRVAGDALN